MKYEALICDVDGTLIESKKDARPSSAVKEAIKQAKEKIHIGIATARPYLFVRDIMDELDLTSPCILGNGVQIYDPVNKTVLLEHTLPLDVLERLFPMIETLGVDCMVQETKNRVHFTKNYQPEDPLYVYVPPFSEELAKDFVEGISQIPELILHKMVAWDKGKVDYLITHHNATKQHAILEVARILEIEPHQIIGVGDGYNDFPLLMACGLKVAMGNAVDDLKAIADYIAPSVKDDGVADVIYKYVLT